MSVTVTSVNFIQQLFFQNGLDYVLTYHDDPQANIPTYAYNWIVNRGGPYFLKQVHVAAKKLEKTPLRRTLFNETNQLIKVNKEDSDCHPSVESNSGIPNYSSA